MGGEGAQHPLRASLAAPLPRPAPPPTPVRPGGQRQEKAPTRSTQVAPGAQVAAAQSSRFSSQRVPPQPLTHTQWKPPAAFRQVPPFWQRGARWGAHSSTSSEQSRPAGAGRPGLGGGGGRQGLSIWAVGTVGAVNLASRTHLSRPRGRGRCRCPAHPGRCPRSDTGAWHSHRDSAHSAGL